MKPKNNSKQPIRDLCQTPPIAVQPLLPYLNKNHVVWECAAGEGYIVNELELNGFTVVASELQRGHNFFSYEPESWDCIVTNPPFSIKFEWITRCYQLGKPFALLMPVEVLGAKSAQRNFKAHGIEVILLDKRVNFKMPEKGWLGSGAQFPTAWFTWGLNIGKQITFATL